MQSSFAVQWVIGLKSQWLMATYPQLYTISTLLQGANGGLVFLSSKLFERAFSQEMSHFTNTKVYWTYFFRIWGFRMEKTQ